MKSNNGRFVSKNTIFECFFSTKLDEIFSFVFDFYWSVVVTEGTVYKGK